MLPNEEMGSELILFEYFLYTKSFIYVISHNLEVTIIIQTVVVLAFYCFVTVDGKGATC